MTEPRFPRRRVALVFAAAIAACFGTVAVAQSQPPAGAAARTAPDKFALPDARNLVMELPEVKVWQDKRREEAAKLTGGAPPPGGILTSRRLVKNVKYWAVTLFDNPRTAPTKWAVFVVRASDGKVFVEGPEGKLVTLEEWRRTRPAV